MRWPPLTRAASCIATSSRRTCSSRATAASRSSTSASPSSRRPSRTRRRRADPHDPHRRRAWRSARSATWRPSRSGASRPMHAIRHLRARRDPLRDARRARRRSGATRASQTVNAVLESDPPPSAGHCRAGLGGSSGAAWRRAPTSAFQTARDLAFALRTLSDTGTTVSETRRCRRRAVTDRWWWRRMLPRWRPPITASGAWSLAATLVAASHDRSASLFQPVTPIGSVGLALSPDGTSARVRRWGAGRASALSWSARRSSTQSRLTAPRAPPRPSFRQTASGSPFRPGGKLKKVRGAGGTPVDALRAP